MCGNGYSCREPRVFWGGTFNLAVLLRQQTKTPGSLAAVTARGGKCRELSDGSGFREDG